MAAVDYDINLYRRRYFSNHPEKRKQYRTNEAISFLVRNYGADTAKLLIDMRATQQAGSVCEGGTQ